MMKICTTTEIQLERVVEHVFNTPMQQIMEEIVEFEEIVDIPVLQIGFIFVGVTFLCCGIERCTFFEKKINFT